MLTIFFRILLNATLLFLTAKFVPDISFAVSGELSDGELLWIYARAGVAMALVNALVTPLLKLLFFPLILITFGLASGLLNIFALWFLSLLLPNLTISSLLALLYGTVIFSIGNSIVNRIL